MKKIVLFLALCLSISLTGFIQLGAMQEEGGDGDQLQLCVDLLSTLKSKLVFLLQTVIDVQGGGASNDELRLQKFLEDNAHLVPDESSEDIFTSERYRKLQEAYQEWGKQRQEEMAREYYEKQKRLEEERKRVLEEKDQKIKELMKELEIQRKFSRWKSLRIDLLEEELKKLGFSGLVLSSDESSQKKKQKKSLRKPVQKKFKKELPKNFEIKLIFDAFAHDSDGAFSEGEGNLSNAQVRALEGKIPNVTYSSKLLAVKTFDDAEKYLIKTAQDALVQLKNLYEEEILEVSCRSLFNQINQLVNPKALSLQKGKLKAITDKKHIGKKLSELYKKLKAERKKI